MFSSRQPPSEFKGSKVNRVNEVLQTCTMSTEQRGRCPMIDLEHLLASLVYPEVPGKFMDTIWNKKAFAVLGAPPARYEIQAFKRIRFKDAVYQDKRTGEKSPV
eukprot:110845-Amorphochlora_amoeboformis.AAC.2